LLGRLKDGLDRHILCEAMIGRLKLPLGLALAIALMPVAAGAQDQTPPVPSQSAQPATTPPAAAQATSDLERVKAQLNRAPALKLDDNQLRFYIEVVAKQPSIADVIGSYDLINGPTKRGAPMTHPEFLNMVTPQELYGSGGIKSYELLQFALTNWLGQQIIKKAIEDIRNANNDREVEEIRARINRELAALKGGG
jgi:hypothetical protein